MHDSGATCSTTRDWGGPATYLQPDAKSPHAGSSPPSAALGMQLTGDDSQREHSNSGAWAQHQAPEPEAAPAPQQQQQQQQQQQRKAVRTNSLARLSKHLVSWTVLWALHGSGGVWCIAGFRLWMRGACIGRADK